MILELAVIALVVYPHTVRHRLTFTSRSLVTSSGRGPPVSGGVPEHYDRLVRGSRTMGSWF